MTSRLTPRQRKEAEYEQLFKQLPEHTLKKAWRELVLNDLYFLLYYACGRNDIRNDWLFNRCNEVQKEPNFRLDLWCREHYKSTIITYGLTMQDMLYDPEVTIGLFSITAPTAKKFLEQIRQEFTKNNFLKWLFDDVLWSRPQKDAPKWSKDEGLVLKRQGNPKEATLEAHGLTDSLPTGRHFNIRIYDDVIDARNVSNSEMIQKAIENWELSLALGSAQPTTRYGKASIQRYIGTRYHFNDPYGEIKKRGVAIPRVYPGTDNGQIDGNPVFWTQEYLNDMRDWMGRYTFSCQVLQDPVADEQQGFSRDWLQFWKADHVSHLNLYLLCDPASQKKRMSDYTAFAVIGLGGDGNMYVVSLFRDRLNLTERTNWLLWLHRQYQPLAVGYEKYGKDSDIEHIEYVMERENYRFPIVALGGHVHKEDRIKRLVPDCEQYRFYLPMHCLHTNYEKKQEDMTKVFINEEYVPFPVGLHDDMLDCISRIKEQDLAAKYPKSKAARKIRRPRNARVV